MVYNFDYGRVPLRDKHCARGEVARQKKNTRPKTEDKDIDTLHLQALQKPPCSVASRLPLPLARFSESLINFFLKKKTQSHMEPTSSSAQTRGSSSSKSKNKSPSSKSPLQFFKSPLFGPISFVIAVAALVVSLHHSTRQAPHHHAAPPANQSHTVPIAQTYVDGYQGGYIHLPRPVLKDLAGYHKFNREVKYSKPFKEAPVVLLSKTFDLPGNINEA